MFWIYQLILSRSVAFKQTRKIMIIQKEWIGDVGLSRFAAIDWQRKKGGPTASHKLGAQGVCQFHPLPHSSIHLTNMLQMSLSRALYSLFTQMHRPKRCRLPFKETYSLVKKKKKVGGGDMYTNICKTKQKDMTYVIEVTETYYGI